MLMARVTLRSTALIASESTLILGAVLFTAYLRVGTADSLDLLASTMLPKALLVAGVCQLCLYSRDLYDQDVTADWNELFVRLFQGLGVTSVVLAAVYSWFPELVIGPRVFVVAAVMVALVISSWRAGLGWLTPTERLLMVGTNTAAIALARQLAGRRDLGVDVVGFVEPDGVRCAAPLPPPGVIGTIEDIPAIVRARSVNRVIVSLADARGRLPMDKLLEMRLDGVQFAHLASVYEEFTGKIAVENLRPSWLIFSSGFHKTRLLMMSKRLLDIVVAALGVVLSLPVQLVVALAVKVTSCGPVLYRQDRVGQDGRIFTLYKFRSMRHDAEADTGPVWARVGDDRVTSIGGFLRRMRLDEMPQLWNVLRGDMSLVGPRPERPEFVGSLTRQIAFYGQRHVIKPGVTGWAQVRYTYGASVQDAMEKLQYDLFYVKNMSIALDLYILLRTIKIVLLGRGAC